MLNFAIQNRYGHDHRILKNAIAHFRVIENQLAPHEVVGFCFIGNYRANNTEKIGTTAFAVTDSKIIIAKKEFDATRTKQVALKNINDMVKRTYTIYGEIIFQTQDDIFGVIQDQDETRRTYKALLAYLDEMKYRASQPRQSADQVASEIMRYKRLADDGYITHEDFEAKKKKLLGI